MFSLIPFLIDSIFIGYLFVGITLWFSGAYLPKRFPLSQIITYNNVLALLRALAIIVFMVIRIMGEAPPAHWSTWALLLLEAGVPLVMLKGTFRNSLKGTHWVVGAWAVSALINWGLSINSETASMGIVWIPLLLKLAAHLLLLVFIYIGVTLFKGFD